MNGNPGRLLLAGEDPVALEGLARSLQCQGYETLRAVGAGQTLETLLTEQVDLALLDALHPLLDTVRRLRHHLPPEELAILVLGKPAEPDLEVRVLQAGADDFLLKPVEPSVLLARIQVCLRAIRRADMGSGATFFRGLPGQTLGRYRVLEVLGEGGMGQVFRALDTSLQREVALKVLPKELLSPGHVARFRQEARIMARLAHPQIVPVWDFQMQPLPHLAMELVPGRDLDRILAFGSLPVLRAGRIARDVAQILQVVHRAGVIHRDLKPGNLLIEPSGRVRLVDFGISRLLEAESRLTQPGCTLGTPAYMAPEQLQTASDLVDGRTDLYALGLILYEMLVGDLPLRREGLTGMLAQILHGNPMSPRRLRPEVPEALDQVCLTATERDPDRRYPTAEAMAQALEGCLEAGKGGVRS